MSLASSFVSVKAQTGDSRTVDSVHSFAATSCKAKWTSKFNGPTSDSTVTADSLSAFPFPIGITGIVSDLAPCPIAREKAFVAARVKTVELEVGERR